MYSIHKLAEFLKNENNDENEYYNYLNISFLSIESILQDNQDLIPDEIYGIVNQNLKKLRDDLGFLKGCEIFTCLINKVDEYWELISKYLSDEISEKDKYLLGYFVCHEYSPDRYKIIYFEGNDYLLNNKNDLKDYDMYRELLAIRLTYCDVDEISFILKFQLKYFCLGKLKNLKIVLEPSFLKYNYIFTNERINLIRFYLDTLEDITNQNTISKNEIKTENDLPSIDKLEKIKWNGTQKELAELFVELNRKGWINEIPTKLISNYFTESNTISQILKPGVDSRTYQSTYDQIYTTKYKPQFDTIRNK